MESIPWLVKEAVEFIEKNIKTSDTVFEYGSGGSTLWFAQRAQSVISVEHNREWYQRLKVKIPDNVTLHFIAADSDAQRGYESSNKQTFKAYTTFIDRLKCFDWILIDGRARIACMLHAVSKFKRFLILDDTYRVEYQNAIKKMRSYDCKIFQGKFADGKGKEGETRIWSYIPEQQI